MTFRAAIEEVEPGAPRPGDALVQVQAAGIGYGASA
jgi:D-arabinose 1-dehydrogenase-like Zn-dependent alcohol dehydrogenase